MSNKEFVNMRDLNFDYCQYITEIPDVSGVLNLEGLSFCYCENLIKIHESVGFLNKLDYLGANGCKKLRSFPPFKLTSLSEFECSGCLSLENFPEILGKMENITFLELDESPIKELPFSIQNLTHLERLVLSSCGVVQLPRSILMMPELHELSVVECEGVLISKQDEGDAQVSSLVFENTIGIDLNKCNISDEFIRKGLPLFANVQRLSLCDCNFTILPACIKECLCLTEIKLICCESFLEIGGIPPNLETFFVDRCTSLKDLDLTLFPDCLMTLFLDMCENLQEIRGFSPNIRTLHVIECPSLTSEWTSMLLNKGLHKEGGDKEFLLSGTRIRKWFEYRINGPSISFWFRNKNPAISLCFAIRLKKRVQRLGLNIEVNGISKVIRNGYYWDCKGGNYTVLYDIKQEKFLPDAVLEENKWNHVVCTISNLTDREFIKRIGMHVFKQGRSMEDIQFTDPLLLEEEHRLVDMEDSQRQFMQHQSNLATLPFLETIKLGKGRGLLSLLPPPALIDNVNWHSNLMLSRRRSSTPNFQGCEIVSRKRKIGMLNLVLNNGASEPCFSAPSKVAFNSVVSSFASSSMEHADSILQKAGIHPNQKKEVLVKWILPEPAWVKLNTDGACTRRSRRMGCGGLIRDSDGAWLLGFSKFLGCGNPFLAELWGVCVGLELAWSRRFPKLWVECYSILVIQLVTKGCDVHNPLSSLVQRIQILLRNPWEIKFTHTFREGNSVADCLVGEALCNGWRETKIYEEPPPVCFPFFMNDLRDVASP